MPVICSHCKKEITSKSELLVMLKWWFFPKPLHKACWGEIVSAHAGFGSISYQTGAFEGKNKRHIAVNSAFFTLLAIIALFIGIFIVVFVDLSKAAVTSNGNPVQLSSELALLVKTVLFLVLLIPLFQRFWSLSAFESKLSS